MAEYDVTTFIDVRQIKILYCIEHDHYIIKTHNNFFSFHSLQHS